MKRALDLTATGHQHRKDSMSPADIACFGSWLDDVDFDKDLGLGDVDANLDEPIPFNENDNILDSNDFDNIASSLETPADYRKAIINQVVEEDDEGNLLLQNDLNQMSARDRERVYEDIHGAAALIEETTELVERSLHQLQQEIEKMPHKAAYDLAASQNPQFVGNRRFRLKFLRAERFDPAGAAKRLVGSMQWKLDLFGSDKLCRDIQLDDLDPDAVNNVKGAWQQTFPTRDSRGRAIFFCNTFRVRQDFASPMGVLQMFWYNMMTMLEDEETQKSGVILVMYATGDTADLFHTSPNHPMYEAFWKWPRIFPYVPHRIEAIHFWYDDPSVKPLLAVMQMGAGPYYRQRLRVHYTSSVQEGIYSLMTYGIPTHDIPLGNNGDVVKTKYHTNWLKRRRTKELWQKEQLEKGAKAGEEKEFPGIEIPSRKDVLLGRGRPINEHAGNRSLHETIKSFRNEYDTAKGKGTKSTIAQRIVDLVHQSGGRFLKRNDQLDGWWEEVTNEVALDKVCHGFRAKREKGGKSHVFALVISSPKTSDLTHISNSVKFIDGSSGGAK